MARPKKFDVWSTISLVILALYIIFLIYPLVTLLQASVFKDGVFTWAYFQKFFNN